MRYGWKGVAIFNEHEPSQSTLVLVASDNLHMGAALSAAVLSEASCHVAGIAKLASVPQARRTSGAGLTIAWCPNPNDCFSVLDIPAVPSLFVHTVMLCTDPDACDKAVSEAVPEGVVVRSVRNKDDAINTVPLILSELLEANRIQLSRRMSHSPIAHELLARLTAREIEILSLTAEGHTLEEIAQIISRSFSTVASHRRSIMTKTGLRDRVALTRFAIKAGLVRL